MQAVEYLRAFLFGRLGMPHLGSLFLPEGAFSVFRKDLLLGIGTATARWPERTPR